MTVSLRDVVLAIRYGDASLVAEAAGYVVLGAADQAVVNPAIASVDSVSLSEDGAVQFAGTASGAQDSEDSLRFLLGQLLEYVRASSPNLERVASRRETRTVRGLVEELEAALVPVNRRAAKRTLARLFRETKKSAAREHEAAAVEPKPYVPAPLAEAPLDIPVDFSDSLEAEPLTELATAAQAPAVPQVASPPVEPLPPMAVQETGPKVVAPSRGPHENTLSSLAHSYARTPQPEPIAQPELLTEADVFDDEDDEEPTQIFTGAIGAPLHKPPIQRVDSRAATPIPEEVSLIPEVAPSSQRRASDVTDLLERARVETQPGDELYAGLKMLSRVEHSPAAPPVGASWMDREGN